MRGPWRAGITGRMTDPKVDHQARNSSPTVDPPEPAVSHDRSGGQVCLSRPATIKGAIVTAIRRQWLVPTGLIGLSLVPVAAGAARLTQLAAGTPTAQDARFFDAPLPVIVHILGASVFCILGAFQFVPSLRRGGRSWHRRAGRLLVPFGLAAA